ncbi:hypothetical protein LTR86_008709 [Recurvomyces mirabilis]|nr:hypothetical protein LTR86_008709 [Recurvomyces mirabilis]
MAALTFQTTLATTGKTRSLDDIDEEREHYSSGPLPPTRSSGLDVGQHRSAPSTGSKRQRHGFVCNRPGCNKSFKDWRSLKRHHRESSCSGTITKEHACSFCGRTFARDGTRRRHEDEIHYCMKRLQPNAKACAHDAGNTSASSTEPHGDGHSVRSVPRDSIDDHFYNQMSEPVATPKAWPDAVPGEDRGGSQSDGSCASMSSKHDSLPGLARHDSHLESDASDGTLTLSITNFEGAETTSTTLTLPRMDVDDIMMAEAEKSLDFSDAGTWISEFMEFIAKDADWCQAWLPQDDGEYIQTVHGEDSISISSKQSTSSVRSMLRRMQTRKPRDVSDVQITQILRHPITRNCLYCSLPWETDELALRQHLDDHIKELASDDDLICRICQINFVRVDDLTSHQESAAQKSCCALKADHMGACEGHACGLTFKHRGQCAGHHAPSPVAGVWSDHDGLKYSQLLLRLVQSSAMRSQAGYAITLKWRERLVSTSSLPSQLLRRRSIQSIVPSIFSFRSEPPVISTDLEDLRLHFARTALGKPVDAVRRGLLRVTGREEELVNQLRDAALAHDAAGVARVADLGASARDLNSALPRAILSRDAVALDILLDAGACLSIEMLPYFKYDLTVEVLMVILKHGTDQVQNLADTMLCVIMLDFATPNVTRADSVRSLIPYLTNPSRRIHPDKRIRPLLRSKLRRFYGDCPLEDFPLLVVLESADYDTAELILRNGAHASYEVARSVLFFQASFSVSGHSKADALRLLIKYGLDVDCHGQPGARPMYHGKSPLLYLSILHNVNAATKLFLQASRNPNSKALHKEMERFPDREPVILDALFDVAWALSTCGSVRSRDVTAVRCQRVLNGNFAEVDPGPWYRRYDPFISYEQHMSRIAAANA